MNIYRKASGLFESDCRFISITIVLFFALAGCAEIDTGGGNSNTNPGDGYGDDAGGDGGSLPDLDAGLPGDTDTSSATDSDVDGDTDSDSDSETDEVDAGMDAGQSGGDGGSGTDTDTDTTPDECPDDPDKKAPGECGCGIPDDDIAGFASCTGLLSALIHRYRFEGSGTVVTDSVGSADGSLINTSLGDTGTLVLQGGSVDTYAALPSGLLSALPSTTVEFWITWSGGDDPNQRTLSFGTTAPASAPAGTCTGSPEYNGGSWYQICTDSLSWQGSRTLCEDALGELVAIGSQAEQDYIATKISSLPASVWMAANDLATEGEWHWATQAATDGGAHFWTGVSDGSAVGGAYTNWADAQPDNWTDPPYSGENCGLLTVTSDENHGKWNDIACAYTRLAACEWRGLRGTAMDQGLWFTTADATARPLFAVKTASGTSQAQATSSFPMDTTTQVALVIDDAGAAMYLYVGGSQVASDSLATGSLGALRDADNWLGRSHINTETSWGGTIHELRIYNSALTAEQLATSALAGPDPDFLTK